MIISKQDLADLRRTQIDRQLLEHGICQVQPVTHEQVQSYVNKILEESQCK